MTEDKPDQPDTSDNFWKWAQDNPQEYAKRLNAFFKQFPERKPVENPDPSRPNFGEIAIQICNNPNLTTHEAIVAEMNSLWNSHVLAVKEENKQLREKIGEAFDAGRKFEHAEHFGRVPNPCLNKDQWIMDNL
jgi:hypothetical protein